MTETCGAVTANPRSVLDSESIGVPVPLVKVKVIDVNTGKKLGPGQLGEIRVKGPCCSRGYINNEEATNELYDGEGFLKCGTGNVHCSLLTVTSRQRLVRFCRSGPVPFFF